MKKTLLILITLSLFTACKKGVEAPSVEAADAGIEKPYGDMLIIGTIGEPMNLIPAIAHDSASHDVTELVYNGLTKSDKNMGITADLAESWEISPDNKSITFRLRQNVRWHDGKPFTAEDVLFTYRFMIDNNTPTAYDADFLKISSIEAADNYTVTVSYHEPYARALSGWGMSIMPKHLLEGVPATKSPLQRHPIGTGPYKFESWPATAQTLTLVANHDYFEGRPHVEKLMFRFMQDQGAAFLELLNGGIDQMGLTAAQYTRQTDTARFQSQYNRYTYLDNSFAYIGYNLTRKPFNDKALRHALSHAVPVERIIETVLHGLGVPATGPYKPGSYWYNPDIKTYPYDPAKARELLIGAGYSYDAEGRLLVGGKPFTLELVTNNNTTRIQIAEIVQKSWGEIGIGVKIRVAEWGAFITDIDKRNFDATILGWNIVIDPDPSAVWRSDGCAKRSTLNFVCYQNPEADALMDAAIATMDEAERRGYYNKFQEILAEDQPYTFLYVPDALVALSNRFQGIEPAPAGISYNLIDWYVPQEQVKYKVGQ